MNFWYLAATSFLLIITLAHGVLGERTTVQTLLASDIEAFPKLELNLVWHLLSIQFLAYTGMMGWLAFNQSGSSTPIALFVAANFVLYTIYFLIPIVSGRSNIKQLPQPILMAIIATLIFAGTF